MPRQTNPVSRISPSRPDVNRVGPWMRPLGSTGLTVSAVTAGAAPLGSMPEEFGYAVHEQDAVDLVQRILGSRIRAIDTSNNYSAGESEKRVGEGIRRFGHMPGDVLIATKVDALDGDYSGSRVRQSIAESMQRLGMDFLPLVYLHDPEFHDFGVMTQPRGAVDTLVRLRHEGLIGHIGVAGGDVHEIGKYLDLGVFEVLLTHNRWTIVDRSAGSLVQRAFDGGMAVVNAAIYGGGILADRATTRYGYRQASPATLQAVERMRALCAEWGTDLPSAALLFSLRDKRISSTVVGFSKPERIVDILATAQSDLPEPFWGELLALAPAPEHWLDA
jgi:D-threo-aldose 1-dehydrogenase